MRLELGSGGRPTPGFTTLDIRPGIADIQDDATTLEKIKSKSCEEIRAAHLLEHFGRLETETVLRVWRDRLKPGGTLHIEVPNLTGHIRNWRAKLCTDEKLVEALFGEQDYPENTHKTMFTGDLLHTALDRAGFTFVSVRDIGCVLIATARR